MNRTEQKAIENITQLDRYWDEYNAQGIRIVPRMHADNCHELMDITSEMQTISTAQFVDNLTVSTDGERKVCLVSGDNIIIQPDGTGRIDIVLKGVYISGMKKMAVLKNIIRYGTLIDTPDNPEWSLYIVEWNGYIYTIGMGKEHSGSFISEWKPRHWEPDAKDYYALYNNRVIKREAHPVPQLSNAQYGDHATGLGSIFTQPIKDELVEIMQFINKIKDDPEYKEELHMLAMLCDNAH